MRDDHGNPDEEPGDRSGEGWDAPKWEPPPTMPGHDKISGNIVIETSEGTEVTDP
jgi:hypothetical protein